MSITDMFGTNPPEAWRSVANRRKPSAEAVAGALARARAHLPPKLEPPAPPTDPAEREAAATERAEALKRRATERQVKRARGEL